MKIEISLIPFAVFQNTLGTAHTGIIEVSTKRKKLQKRLISAISEAVFIIQTLSEVFIGNSPMLIFPTFSAHPFRQTSLFSHRFQSFQ